MPSDAEIQRLRDAELRDKAWAELTQTTVGWNKAKTYSPAVLATTRWGKAKGYLDMIGRNQTIPPPVPPATASAFGGSLPARLAQSTGSTTNVASTAALSSALSSVANGSIINITADLNGGGSTLTISRGATAAAPITITSDPGVNITNFSQWYITGQYLRFRGLDISTGIESNFKATGTANYIEFDGCTIYSALGQGILVTSAAQNIQIWNNTIHTNGSVSGQDHGIYFSSNSGAGVIANNLIYNSIGYNIQAYPNASNLIVTCNTLDDGQAGANARGGIVVGSETLNTNNTILVGNLCTYAPYYGIRTYQPGTGNNSYDCIGYGNGSGDFEVYAGMTYTNCSHADPLYTNRASRDYTLQAGSPAISKIQSARYGYVPTTDKNGNTRTTADAGCYRRA